ncbi:phosphoadenylylsulfate reductase (thioredoxin) [Fodinibius salinus]|uniref:Adenosine 5'-phosphosulfate reductase n=1 Tax=Fodinibius salinus TaxID=860790 RepID=A0A5D3YJ23_9BACT|nr:phosphoadenylyl-sulfate reductase [Fodinibius salinus]TYP93773.1 phosphoadenylylsulfate reductase (thioredoxin) [Fodinibius salinus]
MDSIKNELVPNEELSDELLSGLNTQFEMAGPDEVLLWGYDTFGAEMVLGTGFGPSGMFLIYRLWELGVEIPIFYLDTHLLFDETYALRDRVEERFNIQITRVSSDLSLDKQAQKHGEKLWQKDPNKCCHLRKVLPLRNYLSDKKAWITGVRRSQSETRKSTQYVEWDPENEVVKLNPLANYTTKQVWNYIHSKNLPYNPLHDEGYPSIGCIPCTDAVEETAGDERAGRWNGSEKTECGIHLSTQQ